MPETTTPIGPASLSEKLAGVQEAIDGLILGDSRSNGSRLTAALGELLGLCRVMAEKIEALEAQKVETV